MAMLVDAGVCVDCGACVEPCPNQAIRPGGEAHAINGAERPALSDKFYIIPELCTQCVGYYEQPQCVTACPLDCIAADPNRVESAETLQAKSRDLRVSK